MYLMYFRSLVIFAKSHFQKFSKPTEPIYRILTQLGLQNHNSTFE